MGERPFVFHDQGYGAHRRDDIDGVRAEVSGVELKAVLRRVVGFREVSSPEMEIADSVIHLVDQEHRLLGALAVPKGLPGAKRILEFQLRRQQRSLTRAAHQRPSVHISPLGLNAPAVLGRWRVGRIHPDLVLAGMRVFLKGAHDHLVSPRRIRHPEQRLQSGHSAWAIDHRHAGIVRIEEPNHHVDASLIDHNVKELARLERYRVSVHFAARHVAHDGPARYKSTRWFLRLGGSRSCCGLLGRRWRGSG